MDNNYSIHWLQDIIKKLEEGNLLEITLSTGKTPSGHIHIGILREIIICDALRRIFEKDGKKVNFYLFLDDLDAAKRFPDYIDKNFQESNLGKPFSLIPCPFKECGCESYAFHFGNELISTFKEFGIKNNIIWTSELYKSKDMQEKIKIALENTQKIKKILKKYIFPTLDEEKKNKFIEMQKTWMPVMVICEKCDRIQAKTKDGTIKPNRVLSYLKETQKVIYKCPACGYNGTVSIYSGKLKLNWRVDWPAKWALFKTSCEPAGKDHSVKGGAYDTGLEICQEIFDYEGPIKVPYEWLRLGDQDMKTSKGIIFTPNNYLRLADPEIFRMLILRTNPMKHISLRIEELPQYHDYYDTMENVYYNSELAEIEQDLNFFCYVYPLTKINGVSDTKPTKLGFKILTFFAQVQNILSFESLYNKAISTLKSDEEIITIEEFRFLLKRTENWINEVKRLIDSIKDNKTKNYLLNKIELFSISEKVDENLQEKLTEKQIKGLTIFRDYLQTNKEINSDIIQNKIFKIAKNELKIPPRKMFEALYLLILGKKSGPRLGSFIIMLDREWLLDRLSQLLKKANL